MCEVKFEMYREGKRCDEIRTRLQTNLNMRVKFPTRIRSARRLPTYNPAPYRRRHVPSRETYVGWTTEGYWTYLYRQEPTDTSREIESHI